MKNVVDPMKLLGLEGGAHLGRVSASEGPKFRETVARVCRAGWSAGLKSASGGIGAKIAEGRRQVVSLSGSCFSEVDA